MRLSYILTTDAKKIKSNLQNRASGNGWNGNRKMKPETRKLRAEEEMVVRAIDVKIEIEETCTRLTCILTSSPWACVPPHLSTYPISFTSTTTESVGYLIQHDVNLLYNNYALSLPRPRLCTLGKSTIGNLHWETLPCSAVSQCKFPIYTQCTTTYIAAVDGEDLWLHFIKEALLLRFTACVWKARPSWWTGNQNHHQFVFSTRSTSNLRTPHWH